MAFVEHKLCPVCEKPTQFVNGKCVDCTHRKRLEELHHWDSMSYDDRLTDLRGRVERLEAGGRLSNTTY